MAVLLVHISALNFVVNWTVLVTTQSGNETQIQGQVSPHYYVLLCILFFPKSAYTECNRRNVGDFGRVFLRSNYTDITQNTYIQS